MLLNNKLSRIVLFSTIFLLLFNLNAFAEDMGRKSPNCSEIARQAEEVLRGPDYKKRAFTIDSCAELEHTIKLFSLFKNSSSHWAYKEEIALRNKLSEKFGVQVPSDIMVAGYIERVPPDGNSYILILGVDNIGDRIWPVGHIASEEKKQNKRFDRNEISRILLDGWSPFSKMGYYPRKTPADSSGYWVDISSADGWGLLDPMRRQARSCLPCEGWLCDSSRLICFTDFNDNRREEIHTEGRAPDFSTITVFEITPHDKLQKILAIGNGEGYWKNRSGQWIFIESVTCEGGAFCGDEKLGNPNCPLPSVYRFGKDGLLHADTLLRHEYYPVEDRSAPQGCKVDKPVTVLLGGRFVRYLPK